LAHQINEEDNSAKDIGGPRGGVKKSRRYLLGAIPVAALAVAACGSEKSDDESSQDELTQPNPSTPEDAIRVLMDGNKRFEAREPQHS
jgi:hypothetical protein